MDTLETTPPPVDRATPSEIEGGGTVLVLKICAVLSLLVGVGRPFLAKSLPNAVEAAGAGPWLCFICALTGAEIVNQLRALRAAARRSVARDSLGSSSPFSSRGRAVAQYSNSPGSVTPFPESSRAVAR